MLFHVILIEVFIFFSCFFFFKQKTAYEMRISDWSSDVCSSDLPLAPMVKEWRRDFAAGGARRDLAIAKVMVGSGVGATIAELAAKGIVTGSAPSDDKQRRLLLATGWQPYSNKIGAKY